MRRLTLEIGRTEMGGTHLNLVDENSRETGRLSLGELIEQITGLAIAEGWPPRAPEVYPMLTPQQQEQQRLQRLRQRFETVTVPF